MTNQHIPTDTDHRPLPVLVVDDGVVSRQIVRDVLAEEGFAVTTAANGLAAVRRAAQRPPAFIILDMTLPEMDGYEVADALRVQRQ